MAGDGGGAWWQEQEAETSGLEQQAEAESVNCSRVRPWALKGHPQ